MLAFCYFTVLSYPESYPVNLPPSRSLGPAFCRLSQPCARANYSRCPKRSM